LRLKIQLLLALLSQRGKKSPNIKLSWGLKIKLALGVGEASLFE
jgi:hypothetical protein